MYRVSICIAHWKREPHVQQPRTHPCKGAPGAAEKGHKRFRNGKGIYCSVLMSFWNISFFLMFPFPALCG